MHADSLAYLHRPALDPPGVRPEMLSPKFWIDRMDAPHARLASEAKLRDFNRLIAERAPSIVAPETWPESLSGEELQERITSLGMQADGERYDKRDQALDQAFWDRILENRAIDRIGQRQAVRLGVVARRAAMRTFPTAERVYKIPGERDLDRFMETTLYPGEPLAVLWTSRDGRWLFAQAPNYNGWIEAGLVALAPDREAFERFANPEAFLVVCERQVATAFNPARADISELRLDIGTRLPLVERDALEPSIDGQSPSGNYVVLAPGREADSGRLQARPALLSSRANVSIGWQEFTRANIVERAFECLGERYGWGGMYNARDCSALVADVFRCFGLRLPRNANAQESVRAGRYEAIHPASSASERFAILRSFGPGAALFLPGHVMLLLGEVDERFFVIHAFGGHYVPDGGPDATLRFVPTNQVMVTDLSLRREDGKTYLEKLTGIRDFVPQ